MSDEEKSYTYVLCPPGEKARAVTEFGDSLLIMQKAIGGLIEHHPMVVRNVHGYTLDAWWNEEARLEGLPPNRELPVVGVVLGPVLVIASKNGETVSLGDHAPLLTEAIEWVSSWERA